MRLPWPFGRSQAAPADTEPNTDADADALAAAIAAEPGPAAPAPPTGAWSRLPPIQRASGDPPLVAPASTFLEDVPGAQGLPPIVGQLGHDVTPLAPAGLVAAPVHAVPSLTSRASLVDRPVQRHGSEAQAEAGPEPEVEAPVQRSLATSAAPVPPSVSAPARASSSDAPVAVAPQPAAKPPAVEAPVRHLPAVEPGAAADVPRQSLTRADAWTPPAASPDRPLVHRTNVQTSARGTSPSSEPSPSPTTANAPTETPHAEAASTRPATQPAARASSPRPAPRPGLGAPLATAPATAVQRTIQRASGTRAAGPAGTGMPHGMPGLPANPLAGSPPLPTTVQRRGAAARAAAAGGDGVATPLAAERPGSRQAPYVGSPRSGDLPSLPVVSRSVARDSGDPDAPEPTVPPATGQGTQGPDVAPRPTMPLVSAIATPGIDARPGPAATPTAQRTPAATPPAPPGPDRRPLVGARPLRPSVPTPTEGEAVAGAPATQPATSATTGPGDSAVLWSNPLLPAVPSFPPVQRETTTDVVGSPAFGGIARPAVPGTAPQVQPTRREAGPMTLARPQAAITAALAAQDGGVSAAGSTNRPPSSGATAGPNNTTIVQMTPAQALATPVIAPTATAVVQRADGAPPPVDAEDDEKSESELEDLARAIFPRIQRQLRMQYVYEREARGLPFDP